MSLKYIDKNGTSHIISGLTPGGNLETGAVATRSGMTSVVVAQPNYWAYGTVTFSEPMPDDDYLVELELYQQNTVYGVSYVTKDNYKTANGFRFIVYNQGTTECSVQFKYTAYKLYTVADAEQLMSTVNDIETMIPANASSTNKFTTADDLRTETRTLDRRLDNVEDAIPISASITNKLVTQSDLSGVEIDKVEDINDVELTNIKDGQTLIWDNTNSKWVNGQGGKVYTAGNGINISGTDEISTNTDNTSVVIGNNKELKVANTYKTIFVGTHAEWDALSTADKVKYNEAHITDDVIGGEVADEIVDGDMRPVTSNAVYYDLHYRIQKGIKSLPTTDTSGIGSVTFDTPFNSVPIVVANYNTPSANEQYVTEASVIIMGITTTGFSFKWKSDQLVPTSGFQMSKSIRWIAME